MTTATPDTTTYKDLGVESVEIQGPVDSATVEGTPTVDLQLRPDDPEWLRDAALTVGELLALDADWDTYGAPPIERVHAQIAVSFLQHFVARRIEQAPWVVPTPKRGVQLEWHVEGLDVEVTFDDDGAWLLVGDEDVNYETAIGDDAARDAWRHVLQRLGRH